MKAKSHRDFTPGAKLTFSEEGRLYSLFEGDKTATYICTDSNEVATGFRKPDGTARVWGTYWHYLEPVPAYDNTF